MANSRSGESIIERVTRILKTFDDDHLTMSVAELARRADLPSSTTHRLVDELVATGLLDRIGGEIALGLRLWELTGRSSRLFSLRETARPHLEKLRDQLNHHVFLSVLDRHEVLYLDRLDSRHPTVNITKTASRLPAHAVSAGHVLMAHAPSDVQENFLRSRFAPYTARTITNPDQLRRLLAQVRQQGYAVAERAIIEPSNGISVPIRGVSGDVVAAVGLVVPDGDDQIRQTAPILRSVAADITAALISAASASNRRSA